ncbi:uncharacterized protein EV422DRAFT_523778 [Fimicolochytrium jonesii]|uniref:uncharacterized protein n=1 Tax=Fimicolochytrium jonesii TaxID=1396493 RepID=UPI0022FDFE7B|nr:uncharacterized protein EV422DRAFT_523778 [Fimicolochytrium jonesii]KAI8822383.1 hypothetical protein EV422DRAFT_523778 [Fimicolochytrium jonesii]
MSAKGIGGERKTGVALLLSCNPASAGILHKTPRYSHACPRVTYALGSAECISQEPRLCIDRYGQLNRSAQAYITERDLVSQFRDARPAEMATGTFGQVSSTRNVTPTATTMVQRGRSRCPQLNRKLLSRRRRHLRWMFMIVMTFGFCGTVCNTPKLVSAAPISLRRTGANLSERAPAFGPQETGPVAGENGVVNGGIDIVKLKVSSRQQNDGVGAVAPVGTTSVIEVAQPTVWLVAAPSATPGAVNKVQGNGHGDDIDASGGTRTTNINNIVVLTDDQAEEFLDNLLNRPHRTRAHPQNDHGQHGRTKTAGQAQATATASVSPIKPFFNTDNSKLDLPLGPAVTTAQLGMLTISRLQYALVWLLTFTVSSFATVAGVLERRIFGGSRRSTRNKQQDSARAAAHLGSTTTLPCPRSSNGIGSATATKSPADTIPLPRNSSRNVRFASSSDDPDTTFTRPPRFPHLQGILRTLLYALYKAVVRFTWCALVVLVATLNLGLVLAAVAGAAVAAGLAGYERLRGPGGNGSVAGPAAATGGGDSGNLDWTLTRAGRLAAKEGRIPYLIGG